MRDAGIAVLSEVEILLFQSHIGTLRLGLILWGSGKLLSELPGLGNGNVSSARLDRSGGADNSEIGMLARRIPA